MTPSFKMYSKFVPPNWTLLSYMKCVGKWLVADHHLSTTYHHPQDLYTDCMINTYLTLCLLWYSWL